ncbi:MAG TPA: PDZ domain-containing protein [Polyangiaceae bacterium]|jgi:tricorn protease
MKSQSRAIALFAAVGAVLVVIALVVPRYWTPTEGVATLPSVPEKPAPLPPAAAPLTAPANDHVTRLLRWPGVSKTQIAFSYAGQLWIVPREGGEARRLVTGQLQTSAPHFSPDGSMIAYTGMLDENGDVYVVPTAGGEPKRLTYHPSWDEVVGWSPDGTRILFMSWRATARDLPKLFTVSTSGGPPEQLPLPSGTTASYSPDGKRLAYVPFQQWEPHWKKYRGGQTTPIWIADLADSHVTKVPRTDSNDRYPMWVGNTVYFVSDRNGPFTLFSYDVGGNAVKELVPNPDGLEIRYASAGPDAIVYERLGEVHLYDIASGREHQVPITVSADLPETRPHFTHVEPDQILHAAVSPTGKRVLFEARGEILAVPADKGDVRNLTRTPGVADRDPAWSPDGKWIAWLSDDGGEYSLTFRAPDGVNAEKKVTLGEPGSYFYSPRWSPDSKKIALWDKRLNLWLVDVEHPKEPTKVDTDMFEGANFDPSFSPDSHWLAYQKQLPNHLTGLFVYSLDEKSIHPVTDGRSAAACARFDRGGKYLWFFDSTDVGLAATSTMWAMGKPVTSSVYAIVLAKDTPSPVAPQSDEENSDAGAPGGDADKGDKAKDKDKGGKGDDKADAKKSPDVKIDFDGIDQRIVALPFDRANYADIETGKGGVFALSFPTVFADEDYIEYGGDHQPPVQVVRFDLKKRKVQPFLSDIDAAGSGLQTFVVSADGEKVLFEKDKKWFLAGSDEAPKDLGEAALKSAAGMEVWVDPRAEWRQIYHEVWRIERDFLYDPHAHGLDLAAAEKLYSRYLDGLSSRDDLNAVVGDALGNLVLGHVWMQGGDGPHQDHVDVGLLGADYTIEDGRYRIAKILRGENWNPKLRAPLTEPGVDVKEGDYLLAVNGEELRGDDDVSRLFLGRAGKQTEITVGPKPSLNGSRQVTVVPVGSEGNLRLRGWMEDSRKKVDDLSGGKVGYVYVPDTGGGGYTNFNRYYFSQVGKDAVVVDERFNHGGQIADYMVDIMKLAPLMGATTREGQDMILPAQAIYGPKVMIANEMSGSGGDALPWLFKQAKLGPLVGKRTWGGLVGIGGYPTLVDGGSVTAPRWALYGTHGEWEVENHGIAPDVDVEQDPALMRQGHDPQLEKAVALAMDALAKTPPVKLKKPAYVDYGKRLPTIP